VVHWEAADVVLLAVETEELLPEALIAILAPGFARWEGYGFGSQIGLVGQVQLQWFGPRQPEPFGSWSFV
jgi:hypothetical protein